MSVISGKDKQPSSTEFNAELLRIIGSLAQNLHNTRSDELCCDIPMESLGTLYQGESAEYSIDDKTIRFASLEARNRCVASYVFEKNKTVFASNSKMWLDAAHDLLRCEIGKTDTASGRLLALVHETDDILSIAANAIQSKSMAVFDVLHVIKAALPYLNELVVEEVFRLCAVQYEGTKNFLFAGVIFSELERYFVRQTQSARAAHLFFRKNLAEETTSLYSVAIIALAKSSPDEAVSLSLEDAKSQSVILKSAALWVLGRLLASSLVTSDLIPSVSTTIIAHMSDSVEQVRLSAIHAAAQAVPFMGAFDDSLILLGEAGDQHALAAAADALFMNTAEMKRKENFGDWLRLLRKVLPSSKGVLDNFDYVLGQMIADPEQQQIAISCLTEWVEGNAKDVPKDKSAAELFDGTIGEIANRPELLSQVITDWFLSDGRQLAAAAAGLLSFLWVRKSREIEFSAPHLDDLEHGDLIFLVRRMLGFVTSEEHLLSLTMSLLKTKDAPQRTFGLVHSLLIDEIGRDYPSSTIEMLEAANSSTTDTNLSAFYSSAIKVINDRINAIDALPRLTELRPPPRLQRQFSGAHAKQMETASEDAKKHSIIRQIATEIPIKAGIGSFSFHDGNLTEPTHFHSVSTSISLPRRYVIDSVGYEIHGMMFRLAKRGQS